VIARAGFDERAYARSLGIGALPDLSALLGSADGSSSAPLTLALKSNVSPEIDLDASTLTGALAGVTSPAPAPVPSGSSTADLVGAFVQPTIQGVLPDGSRFTVWAPYGESTTDYRVYVAGVLVATFGSLVAVLAFVYWLGKRSGARRGKVKR
jgi:hypothetical protein